jgi:hypothetical protein
MDARADDIAQSTESVLLGVNISATLSHDTLGNAARSGK